ncbi:hypothetical protein AGOR_G00051300 [Albula goreensis]|uniref:Golgin subfamily A conserved domain-containing protein n=1 Tax=Albula goreensis TaxID=1534307 RepID=A0A8T3DUL6_9TELE|nr:hypothetical protein AGOR_G00051300 [Albula goreensis]
MQAQVQEWKDRMEYLLSQERDRGAAQIETLQLYVKELRSAAEQLHQAALTNENMELMSGLKSEQRVKKQLGLRMGDLQEYLEHVKEQYVLKQGQQEQFMEQLQGEAEQDKSQLQQSHQLLWETQRLTQLATNNEELRKKVQALLNRAKPPTSRNQGDGQESQPVPESYHTTSLPLPNHFSSREEMEQFLVLVIYSLEGDRDNTRQCLEEERRMRQAAFHQEAVQRKEQQCQ